MHETNTFLPTRTSITAFLEPGFWPGLKRGEDLLKDLPGLNIGTAGVIQELTNAGYDLVPLTWAAAPPAGIVTVEAFESIAEEIVGKVESSHVDGVILELHGAMVAEHLDDAEGELLERVRAAVGPDVPVLATVDLHANLSTRMLSVADAIEAYRTYPHVDMADTGARAARLLIDAFEHGVWYKTHRRLDYLIPTPWQCTEIEPARTFYADMIAAVDDAVPSISFAPGFNAADVACCGPVLFAYGRDRAALSRKVDELHGQLVAAEPLFGEDVYSASEAVDRACALTDGSGPVIIADAEDNPGGGAGGDTTALLRTLVAKRVDGAVVATICDARAVECAAAAGEGATVSIRLGGSSDGKPFDSPFVIERIATGTFEAKSPMFRGARTVLGRMALLRCGGVRVIVASKPFQVADRGVLQHVGIEPKEQKIIVLKSTVHFRNDFQAIASAILIAAAGGAVPIDPRQLPFSKLDRKLRLFPQRMARV